MKIRLSSARLLTQIASVVFVLTLAKPGRAQSLPNYTNFPMIGVVRGQSLLVNLVAFPPDPCFATIGFQNNSGSPIGPSLNVALQAGQSASLTLNGNTLTNLPGQRVEVVPTVTLTAGIASQCNASAEVYDNILEISSVIVPGVAGFAPSPQFGMFGVTELQTARLNVVAYPTDPCIGQLSFVNSNGVPVGNTMNVQLASGQAAFLELPGSTLVTKLGQRAEVQPWSRIQTEAALHRPRSTLMGWAPLRPFSQSIRAARRAAVARCSNAPNGVKRVPAAVSAIADLYS